METRKAVWAVVAVIAAGVFRCNEPSADLAGENIVTSVSFVITFFKLFSFVFAIHVDPPEKYRISGGTAGNVICRPPGQRTLSVVIIEFLKKISF